MKKTSYIVPLVALGAFIWWRKKKGTGDAVFFVPGDEYKISVHFPQGYRTAYTGVLQSLEQACRIAVQFAEEKDEMWGYSVLNLRTRQIRYYLPDGTIDYNVAGIGKVRRNIFAEIEFLQKIGVNLADGFDSLTQQQKRELRAMADFYNYRPSSRSPKSPDEQYYNSLRRQYLKLVNPAIGRIQYPHTTSTIRNSRGDVVLTYNDYDPEKDMQAAMDFFSDTTDPWARTVYAIAAGHKWIWKGKKKGGQLLTRGLADELFFSRTNLEGERRLYRALIDNRNGWTVDKFAELYLDDVDGAKDAALDALKQFPTPKRAKEYILDQYYQSLDDGDDRTEADEVDLPF